MFFVPISQKGPNTHSCPDPFEDDKENVGGLGQVVLDDLLGQPWGEEDTKGDM